VRSSGRIPKEIPILLIGSDLGGKVFSEHTSTILLSLHGAGVLSRHKLSPEQELVLRWPERNKETEIRVVGQVGSQNGHHTYGVAFFDTNLNFWEIDFPLVSAAQRELGLLSLVCSHCKTLEKVDDSGPEADVCATNEGVLRFCKRCGSSTLWKPANAAATQQPAAPSEAQLPLFTASAAPPAAPAPEPPSSYDPAPPSSPPAPRVPEPSFYAQSRGISPEPSSASSNFLAARPNLSGDAPVQLLGDPQSEPQAAAFTAPSLAGEKSAAPGVNRRKHPRVKVDYSACVRVPGRADDVVQCEDMSKGGLRFKSRQRYYAQSLIEVAVPYQPGQPAIFVPAQIVFAEELPEQRLFRCGVQYLKATKPRDSF